MFNRRTVVLAIAHALAVVIFVVAMSPYSWAARLGAEFPVNTYTTGSQGNPSVVELSGGGFVVTWHSFGQDGSGYGVYGQRCSAAGARLGSEFKVNTFTATHQWVPSVTGLGDDGFVVT